MDRDAWDRLLFTESTSGIALHEIICDDAGVPIDYRFLDVNPAFEQMTGLRSEQIVGRTTHEVIPDIEPFWVERYGRVALTGVSEQFESYNAALRRYFLVKAYRPAERQFVAVITDVTELRERTAFAETIIASSGDGIAVFDRDLRYVVYNPVIEYLTGLNAADVIGRQTDEAAPWLGGLGIRNQLERALAGETVEAPEFEFVSSVNGRRAWVLASFQPHLDTHGQIVGVVASVRNITAGHTAEDALRLSEQQFRAIFDNAGDAIAIYRPDGAIVEANRVMCERLGYSREELLSMTVGQIDSEESAALFADRVLSVLTQGTATFEVTHVRRDGTLIPVEVVSRQIDFHGDPAILTVQRDITERKRAEAERRELEDQLRQAQKMEGIGRLAGGIAHDFNNLLTAIRGNATLAMASLPPGHSSVEDLEQIEQAADRAAALTRQLLAFARRTVLQPEVVDLAAIVKRLEPMLGRLLGEDVALVTVTPPEPVKVMADPSQIEQVIVNLALNARDAMPDGGILTIETAALDVDAAAAATQPDARPGPTAQLSVSDTGTGMDPDTLVHLFEPFFTTKSQGKGTGLGLATVYGIVRQSGGVVWPRSELGAGSTFTVWLPLTDGRPAASAARSAGPIEPEGKTGGTIVVVEDDAGVRRFATQVLERAGYTVVAAASGAVALRAEVSDGMDLLLTDVVMPTMSGREVADRLSAAHPGLRVLFMSGHADSTIVKHGVLDGSIRYLPKPFTAEVLLAAVHDALTNPVNPAA